MQVNRTYTDIDEHAAQMSGFEQHYLQLSPGSFRGVFTSLALPGGIGFDVEWVGQAVHQQASVPARTVSLVTFLDLQGRAIFNGRELKNFDTFMLPPGTPLDVRTPRNAKVAVVTVPLAVLDDEGSAWAGPSRGGAGPGAARLLAASASETIWAPVLAPLLRALDTRPQPLCDEPAIAAALAHNLLETTLMLLGDDRVAGEPLDLACPRRRREAFVATRDAINRLDLSELSIGALCRMAGISRRTLEYCFDEAVAMSPLQYLKLKRLNGVRRDLMAADSDPATTVGDVAARHGIWHLGRLAREYAQLFGELPSATLHRRHLAGGLRQRRPNGDLPCQ